MWIYSSDYYFWNKLSTTCLAGLYVGLRKYCIFQCEANVEQIIAIVTTSSVSCFISEEQFSCNSTWFYILLKTNCSQKQPPEVFITLLKWDSTTGNGPSWKLIDGSISTIFPHKKQKEERAKILKHRCFPVTFVEFLRYLFIRTLTVTASEDEHDETKLLHMTSGLNKFYLWMICFESFWQSVKMGT